MAMCSQGLSNWTLRPTSRVRHYCGSMALVAGDECNIVRSTVWHGDREQGEIHHIDEIQGIEDLRTLFTQHPDLTERALAGMDRRSPSAMGTSRSTSMVTVMMRDEDGIEILRERPALARRRSSCRHENPGRRALPPHRLR